MTNKKSLAIFQRIPLDLLIYWPTSNIDHLTDCLGHRSRRISEMLLKLMMSPETSIAKRTAVELIGRGFRYLVCSKLRTYPEILT